jgi:hypothetical protein
MALVRILMSGLHPGDIDTSDSRVRLVRKRSVRDFPVDLVGNLQE